MNIIQMWCRFGCNKKLWTICIFSTIRHTKLISLIYYNYNDVLLIKEPQKKGLIMFSNKSLILKYSTIYRFATGAIASGEVTALIIIK
jgi:hypothetical protein